MELLVFQALQERLDLQVLKVRKEIQVPQEPEDLQERMELRTRREQWEQERLLKVSRDPMDSPVVQEALERQAKKEPRVIRDRRVNRVQLARLEVLDLLALLGLPVSKARLDPLGLVVFRVHQE
jgi:hypothetical protein